MNKIDIKIIDLRSKYKDNNILKKYSEMSGINQQSVVLNHDYLSCATIRQQPISGSLYLIDRIANFCVERNRGTLYIKYVETLPGYRRMGIAKNLITISVDEILKKERSIERIVTDTAGCKENIVDGDRLLMSLGFNNPKEQNFIMWEGDDNFYKRYCMSVDKWVER